MNFQDSFFIVLAYFFRCFSIKPSLPLNSIACSGQTTKQYRHLMHSSEFRPAGNSISKGQYLVHIPHAPHFEVSRASSLSHCISMEAKLSCVWFHFYKVSTRAGEWIKGISTGACFSVFQADLWPDYFELSLITDLYGANPVFLPICRLLNCSPHLSMRCL